MTNVLHKPGVFITSFICSIIMVQLEGLFVLATFNSAVLPSVSMNSGSGNCAANVDLPIPSGP